MSGAASTHPEAAPSAVPVARPKTVLDELRDQIDAVDKALLAHLAERVKLVLKVGEYKREHGMAVYDPDRERQVLERLCSALPEPLDDITVKHVFERIIDESRRLEQHHMQRT